MPANVESILPGNEQLFQVFEARSVSSDPAVFQRASVAVTDMRIAYLDDRGDGGWAYVEEITGVELSRGEVSVFLAGRTLRIALEDEAAASLFGLLTDLVPMDEEPESQEEWNP